MASKACAVRVLGRVQGVFYRASSQAAARELGIVGWARNQADGSVAMHVQGRSDAVEAMLAWARKGPPGARVNDIEVTPAEVDAGLEDFEIRR